MKAQDVQMSQIAIGERYRRELGDIDSLAASIERLGVLQPIVLDNELRLIAGYRRVAASAALGYTVIPAVIVDRLDDALLALYAERDENTCRKDFTPTEAVAIGRALEELERPKAAERKAEAGIRNLPTVSGSDSPPLTSGGKVRDIVAPAVGMKPSRYAHAKAVVDAAESHPSDEVREVAAQAVAEMDRTGYVETAYREVRSAKQQLERGETVKPRPQRHPMLRGTRHLDPNRIVNETAMSLEGLQMGLALVEMDQLDASRIDEWAISLKNSLRSFNQFLKEMTRDRA